MVKGCCEWGWEDEALLAFVGGRNTEGDSTIIVGLLRGGQVKVGQRNFLSATRSKIPQCPADDGIVLNFLLMLVAEYQHRRRHHRTWLWNAGYNA
jgi:hypothetical protein